MKSQKKDCEIKALDNIFSKLKKKERKLRIDYGKEKKETLECLKAILQICNMLSEVTKSQINLLKKHDVMDPTQIDDAHRFLDVRVAWIRENGRYSYHD